MYMLTTIDNPFNPSTDFDRWYQYDVEKGYHTCGYLARICKTSDSLSEADQAKAIDDAIDEIVKMNINGLYTKVLVQN